ncbi:cell division protein FtsL [Aliiroseovarius sp. PrR006]|uniref:cell division protein FtsL n=1 Tax=Aliiroseovarius sp. PrR006 TaxID=2706883 RepID=UPI0013D0FB7B|nr:cell division protein FtsL [Aliiroseovarius sp. PrR006]NDW52612.1 cell division protein FtsL [Aliiroseovarius sp. PrR006]
MRSLLYILSALAVMGLAYWAYSENYKTQASLDHAQELQSEIGRMQEELAVLRAEWAYLNRPDRLRDLAQLNYDKLELNVLEPGQFGRVDQIAFAEDDGLPEFTGAVEVMGAIE